MGGAMLNVLSMYFAMKTRTLLVSAGIAFAFALVPLTALAETAGAVSVNDSQSSLVLVARDLKKSDTGEILATLVVTNTGQTPIVVHPGYRFLIGKSFSSIDVPAGGITKINPGETSRLSFDAPPQLYLAGAVMVFGDVIQEGGGSIMNVPLGTLTYPSKPVSTTTLACSSLGKPLPNPAVITVKSGEALSDVTCVLKNPGSAGEMIATFTSYFSLGEKLFSQPLTSTDSNFTLKLSEDNVPTGRTVVTITVLDSKYESLATPVALYILKQGNYAFISTLETDKASYASGDTAQIHAQIHGSFPPTATLSLELAGTSGICGESTAAAQYPDGNYSVPIERDCAATRLTVSVLDGSTVLVTRTLDLTSPATSASASTGAKNVQWMFILITFVPLIAVLIYWYAVRMKSSKGPWNDTPDTPPYTIPPAVPPIAVALLVIVSSLLIAMKTEAASFSFLFSEYCGGSPCVAGAAVYANAWTADTFTPGQGIDINVSYTSDDAPGVPVCFSARASSNGGASYTDTGESGCYSQLTGGVLKFYPNVVTAPTTPGPFTECVVIEIKSASLPYINKPPVCKTVNVVGATPNVNVYFQ